MSSAASKRRTQSWEPDIYYEKQQLSYQMARLGANTRVLKKFFVVDKRLEKSINKELGKFRKGSGWMTTHVVHRVHANIVYRNYCNAVPDNSDFHRPPTPTELLSLARTYLVVYNNQYMDINRIYHIFEYLKDGTFTRKVCNKCGIDYIFHSERNYNLCPFCEKDSTLYSKGKR